MQRIIAIEQCGQGRRQRRIHVEGPVSTEPVTTSASVVKAAGLAVGDVLDDSSLRTVLEPLELEYARQRALGLLGYRERSTHELAERLARDGYPPSVAERVVEDLVRLGLVDDERFALALVRSRRAAGYGRMRIERELADHHIPETISACALDTELPSETEFDRASDSLRGRRAHDRAEAQRMMRRLAARGFDFATARAAVDAVSHAPYDEPQST